MAHVEASGATGGVTLVTIAELPGEVYAATEHQMRRAALAEAGRVVTGA